MSPSLGFAFTGIPTQPTFHGGTSKPNTMEGARISPEIVKIADIKSSCFHSTKINCICALAAKNRMKQATYVPIAKRQKQSETANFFKSRAETLNHWKQQANGNNNQASTSINKGYPGEGPDYTFASANIRRSIGDNKFYRSVKTILDDKVDVIAFQEHNVHRNNQGTLETHKHTAKTLGYKLFIAPTAEVAQIGGTAILVSLQMLSEGSVATFMHSHPNGNYVRVKIVNPQFGTLHVWSVYAPADGTQCRDLFLKMAGHVNPESILMGDFNCVENVAMDTRRSANTPYENTGADVLTFIKVRIGRYGTILQYQNRSPLPTTN
eukprot:1010792-Pleurochrysis_carterae.AAC.1